MSSKSTPSNFLRWCSWRTLSVNAVLIILFQFSSKLCLQFQNEWHIELTDLKPGIDRKENKKNTYGLYINIGKSLHEVREHYYIYDSNSFIADVGGFLGLLMGHSLFGIYCSLEETLFSRLGRLTRR